MRSPRRSPPRRSRRGRSIGSGSSRRRHPTDARTSRRFRQGLRDLGYVEGQNIVIEYRWAEARPSGFPDLAAELVRLKVDVIVASGDAGDAGGQERDDERSRSSWRRSAIRSERGSSPASRARAATSPGLRSSTGAETQTVGAAQGGRPGRHAGGCPLESGDPAAPRSVEECRARRPDRWESSFSSSRCESPTISRRAFDGADRAARRRARCDLADPLSLATGRSIVELAAKHRLPAMYASREYVEAGGLMSYGAELRRHVSARRRLTSTRSSRAPSPPTSPSSSRRSSSWSSTSRPPRRSASRSRRRCWCGRIR